MDLGQRLIIGFEGTEPGQVDVEKVAKHLNDKRAGGVILFDRNIKSPEQLKKLNDYLMQAGGPDTIISVDQEGGRVQRLSSKNGFSDYRSPRHISQTMSPEEAYIYYRGMSSELAETGINLNFGCVLDLHAKPGEDKSNSPIIGQMRRSFGTNVKDITAYALAFVQAHRDRKVRTCLKHYPGHGLATTDSHLGIVDITDTYHHIEREVFGRMIAKGAADMIMTAHVMYKHLDTELPVTLSDRIISKWLRHEDEYDGLVIADDLHMGAIIQNFSFEDTVVHALNAGNDLLIFSNNAPASGGHKSFIYDADLPLRFQEVVQRATNDEKLAYVG